MCSRVTEKDQWHGIGKMINFMLDLINSLSSKFWPGYFTNRKYVEKCLNASLHCLKHFNSILLLGLYV